MIEYLQGVNLEPHFYMLCQKFDRIFLIAFSAEEGSDFSYIFSVLHRNPKYPHELFRSLFSQHLTEELVFDKGVLHGPSRVHLARWQIV